MQIDLIVSRHPAAIEFVADEIGGYVSQSGAVCHTQHPDCQPTSYSSPPEIPVLDSATSDDVRGKVVAGNLPLHLAAEASAVYAIEFPAAPPRGREYGLAEMREAGARLVPYVVFQTPPEVLDRNPAEQGGFPGSVRELCNAVIGTARQHGIP